MEDETLDAGMSQMPGGDAAADQQAQPSQEAVAAQKPSAQEGGYSWEMRYRAAQSKADEHFANWQRSAADIANLRRQTQRERDEVVSYARAALVADLLPVLDQMERLAATAPPFVLEHNWVRGVALLERQLRQLLERQGLQPITCDATREQFDATCHLAVLQQSMSTYPAGTVVAELQRGYRLGDRVLRPTLVAVAAAPEETPAARTSDDKS
jgi:molecular chaperone GrpE